MSESSALDPMVLAEAKAHRVRIFMITLVACAACMFVASSMNWYHVRFVNVSFGAARIENAPEFSINAGKMAAISRESVSSPLVANPKVGQLANLPMFVVAPLIGITISLLGMWIRSAALSIVGLFGVTYGWFQLSISRWWFEQAPGRDGWEITRASGQTLFWFALMSAAASIVLGSIQSVIAYRAMRRARIAAGEVVEETAFDLLVKLATRASSPTSAAARTKD